MKISKFFLLTLFTFLFVLFLGTKVYSNSQKSVEQIVKEIRTNQKLGENDKINADKVSDALLEELGDALMSIMHPAKREHKWMDNMMGGEGSKSLKAMHRAMGYNYLSGSFRGMMGPGMMSYGMSGQNFNGRGRHMGWGEMPYGFRRHGFGFPFMWILIIIFIVFALYFFLRFKKGCGTFGTTHESALDVLKKRYAKGEITKKEFENIKKDIL
jgi:putative membrane protein